MRKKSNSQEKALLIDINALVHRAYHAFPKNLSDKDGQVVNAAYGFSSILLQILKEFKPTHIYCLLDSKEKTFRHKIFEAYKGHRPKTDPELISQFPLIEEIITSFGFEVLKKDGFEADDLIGSLAKNGPLSGVYKIIVTGDRDLMQIVDEETDIYLAGTGFSKSVLMNPEQVKEKLGFSHEYLIDYKGLRGDPSDNIPGVKGIGDKTATELIVSFGHLEGIYENLDKCKPAVAKKLQENREMAFLSRELATIKTDLDIKLTDGVNNIKRENYESVRQLFMKLQFFSLMKRLEQTYGSKKERSSQVSLFNFSDNVDKLKVEFKEINEKTVQKFLNDFKVAETVFLVSIGPEYNIYPVNPGLYVRMNGSNVFLADGMLQIVLDDLFQNNKLNLVSYSAKNLYHFVLNKSIDYGVLVFDVVVADYVLTGGNGKIKTLEDLALSYLGETLPEITSTNDVFDYLKVTEHVYRAQSKQLSEITDKNKFGWNQKRLFEQVDNKLTAVLAEMESAGIFLDKKHIAMVSEKLDSEIKRLEEKVIKAAGTDFNLGSPKQLGEILFEKLNLPMAKKTKSGSYSTNERTLLKYKEDYPIVQDILDYRTVAKLRSTYTNVLTDEVNEKTGRVHSTFHQAQTTTGRLSSQKPNLQNIPVSSEFGQDIRRAFAAPKGKKLLFFDYSQQELRLLAHFSKEPRLIAAFNENQDIHSYTASLVMGKDLADVTKNERRVGKTINFGIVYGISAFGLSERLDVSREEAQSFIDAFYEKYPGVKVFFEKYVQQARERGYAATILDRHREVSGLLSRNFQIRSATEREIINFPLQGSAADMMRLAMIQTHQLIKSKYSKFAKLILQIHDELIFEVETDDEEAKILHEFAKEVRTVMLGVLDLDVTMRVDVEIGDNLSDTKKLKFVED